MMIETGCINKRPIIDDNSMKIVANNEAKTDKKEQYVHLGKGTCVIAKKNIKTQRARDEFNHEKMITTFVRVKDHQNNEERLILSAIHAGGGNGKNK